MRTGPTRGVGTCAWRSYRHWLTVLRPPSASSRFVNLGPPEGGPYRVMTTQLLESLIDDAFERRAEISPDKVPGDLSHALDEIIEGLNQGTFRVAEKIDGAWVTHQWLKKAVLLFFRTHDNEVIDGGGTR